MCQDAAVTRIVDLEWFKVGNEFYPIDDVIVFRDNKAFRVDIDAIIAWMQERGFAKEVER